MKKIILVLGISICCVTLTEVAARPCVQSAILHFANAAFKWTNTTFDFGTIERNVPVNHEFSFTNNGDAPLVITSVQASCGCTVTEYSKEPIEPGASGFVKATYNAATIGAFNKTVTVNANTGEGSVLLAIKGTVVE